MKNIGRRLFAKAMPAAPLVVAETGTSLTRTHIPLHNYVGEAQSANVPVEDAERVLHRKKLQAAREYLRNTDCRPPDRFRREKDSFTTIEANIASLRSVSDQHKIHMHIAARNKLDEEHQSWQESILRMFGLNSKKDRFDLF